MEIFFKNWPILQTSLNCPWFSMCQETTEQTLPFSLGYDEFEVIIGLSELLITHYTE